MGIDLLWQEEKEHDSEDNLRIEEKIVAQCQQTNITKREKFKNPFFVASYLAASGEGKGVNLTIYIEDIPLAGEKHLPVADNNKDSRQLICATT
jgi:hypothetical protein